jgi:hypothetical protein
MTPAALSAEAPRRLLRTWAARAPRRLLLPALGVLAGAAAAAVNLLQQLPAPVATVPPGYVALVNGKGILMSDFISQTQETTGASFEEATPAQRGGVLRDMIDEELMVQEALTLDLPETTTEVRAAMNAAVGVQVAQPLLSTPLTDEDLKAYYEAHRERFMTAGAMNITDLVLHVGGYENADQTVAQAEADAAEAAYQLRSGTDLQHVMDHFGFVDSGRSDGTDQPDFAAKLHLGERLYAVALTLGDGQVADPLVEADGVHVLIMQKRTPQQFADFDAVRTQIYTEIRDAQRRKATQAYLEHLRRDSRILLAPGQHETGPGSP